MAKITFKGNPIHTNGTLPSVGSQAPDWTLTTVDLKDVHLHDFHNKKKILNVYVSIDTGVCAKSTQQFHTLCKERSDVVLLNISMDLPFAFSRFCQAHHLENIHTLSCFRSSFAKDYGIQITDGPIKGLCARAVVVLDEHNHILYTELVNEIAHEPNYEQAIKAL